MQIKTAVIAGTEYKSAIFNIDFDQNVYLLENFPCPCGSCSSTNLPAVNETGYDISALTLNAWAEVFIMIHFILNYHYLCV